MIDDDVDTCLNAIKARWPYQPMSADETKAWRRTLRKVGIEDFGYALDVIVANGGSKTASSPNMRPGVGELMGVVEARAKHRQLVNPPQVEDYLGPETPPEDVPARMAQIREQMKAKGVRV